MARKVPDQSKIHKAKSKALNDSLNKIAKAPKKPPLKPSKPK